MSLLKNVRVSWCSITEPNTKFEHQWEVVANLDKQQAATLADHGFKLRTGKDGGQEYRFKRRCQGTKKTGEKFDKQQPKLVDAARQPFTELVGNGSLCNIQYEIKQTTFAGNSYVNGDLQGVQVIEHVPFGGAADEFGDEGETSTIKGEEKEEVAFDDEDMPF